jgi:3-methyladenine DNA glycosylase AlkD
MASKATRTTSAKDSRSPRQQAEEALAALSAMSTQKDRDNLTRFGIDAPTALGVSMSNIQRLAKRLGRSHELAAALWETGCYEARMLTSFVDEPARVTAAQMDRWCRDFDNWGICDTLCFKLFDQTPHAWAMVAKWNTKRDEFVKRVGVASAQITARATMVNATRKFMDASGLGWSAE